MEDEALGVVAEVVQALEQIGVAYALGGSFASSVHGRPRATNDADLVADVRLSHVEALTTALQDRFYVERAAVEEALQRGGAFNVIHYATAFKVDVFICGTSDFRRAQLARRQLQQVQEVGLHVISPEDIILAKLQWFRDGGGVSERQWRDVTGVITTQAQLLDLEYLRATAADLGVSELLTRALGEAGAGG